MKKLSLLICLLLLVVYAAAQGNKGKAVEKTVKTLTEKTSGKTVRTRVPGATKMPGKVDAALDMRFNAPANAGRPNNAAADAAKRAKAAARKRPEVPPVLPFDLSSPEGIDAFLASSYFSPKTLENLPRELKEKIYIHLWNKYPVLRAELQAQRFQSGIGKSVLFAPDGWDPDVGYSVTVFKTTYDGQEEIFGIIPSHSLPLADHYHDFTVGLDGTKLPIQFMHATGQEIHTTGTVVQVTSPSMLDITLIKLDPDILPLVQPLELAPDNAMLHERLFSYGYAAGTSTNIERTVNAQSFISIRTNQAIEGDRYGFCGSPLLDALGRVKAIHTGSVVGQEAKEDVSYGTNVEFIHKLVEAYHQGGQATYDLVLAKHKLATLNVDEYVADITLFDKQGNVLFVHNFEDKFSQSVVLNALKIYPNAAYVGLTSRTAQLVHTDRQGTILDEHRSTPDETKVEHWYNLQTRQILPARPESIKM